MKTLKGVEPYIYEGGLNFKDRPCQAWKETLSDSPCLGRGKNINKYVVKGFYPRFLHKLMFNFDMPTLWYGEARLCFVQPVSLYFDTFFAGINHEIIPFVWDCWPCYFDKMGKWLKRHKVKTAIFTSRQEMEEMKKRIPEINYLWCPEAINTDDYKEGKPLVERSIDLLEFGRSNEKVLGPLNLKPSTLNHIATKVGDKFLFTEEQLHSVMEDAKVTICLPRSMTQPEIAGNIETLTQRYWEAMLSRMVIVGHCPKELEDIIGYNPVIEIRGERFFPLESGRAEREVREQIHDIINNISDYQELVDRNRKVALEMGDWKVRMTMVRDWLKEQGYQL